MDCCKTLSGENVGGIDLIARAFIGTLALIVLAWGYFSAWQIKLILAIAAFGGVFTSLTRHCHMYTLLGFSTGKKP